MQPRRRITGNKAVVKKAAGASRGKNATTKPKKAAPDVDMVGGLLQEHLMAIQATNQDILARLAELEHNQRPPAQERQGYGPDSPTPEAQQARQTQAKPVDLTSPTVDKETTDATVQELIKHLELEEQQQFQLSGMEGNSVQPLSTKFKSGQFWVGVRFLVNNSSCGPMTCAT